MRLPSPGFRFVRRLVQTTALSLVFALSATAQSADTDGDLVPDASDNCPRIPNGPNQAAVPGVGNQLDTDSDTVGDACDNCVAVANLRRDASYLAARPWATLTGGQRDDDLDGYGNICDGDFDGIGLVIGGNDVTWFSTAVSHQNSLDDCGLADDLPCAIFDLDEIGIVVGGNDVTVFANQIGTLHGPQKRCPVCPLDCLGDNCVLTLDAPLDGALILVPSVSASGTVSDPGASVSVNGVVATIDGATWSAVVPLVLGSNLLVATGTDGSGTSTSSVIVTHDPNPPPVLDPVGNASIPVGSTLHLQLGASDPGGDPLVFTASPLPLPAGAALGAISGAFTFAPSLAQVGSIPLTFSVSDGVRSDVETITITVVGPSPGDPTALQGQVLDAVDASNAVTTPIEGVTVRSISTGASTMTDSDGMFLLAGLSAGEHEFEIDGSTALTEIAYGSYRTRLTISANVTHVVERPFYLPWIDIPSSAVIDPFQTTVVSNPNLGVVLTIPAHTVKNEDTSDFNGVLTISAVPVGFTPSALPSNLEPAMVITVQPMGLTFAQPVQVTWPNLDGFPPGAEVDLWSLDHDTGRFFVAGRGVVNTAGDAIDTVEGGLVETSWHAVLAPASQPDGSDEAPDDGCNQCPCRPERDDGFSTLTYATGAIAETIETPVYVSQGRARNVVLHYGTEMAYPAPVLPLEPTILQRAAVPPLLSYSLEFAGIQQGSQTFVDTSALSESQDEAIRAAIQVDATALPTGVYPYTIKQTSHYASSRVSSEIQDRVIVRNERASPFGTGWGLEGLSALDFEGAEILLAGGDGSTVLFSPAPVAASLVGWTAERQASAGIWALAGDGLTVSTANTQPAGPGWFVSPTDFFNSTLRFTIQPFQPSLDDNDFFGFAVGFRRPILANGDADGDWEMVLFDWREEFQPFMNLNAAEGKALSRVNGETFVTAGSFRPYVWQHDDAPPSFDVLQTRFGENEGWTMGTKHTFEVEYTSNRLAISIDDELVFEQLGTFQTGRFAFYNYSQDNVVYTLLSGSESDRWVGPAGNQSELVRNPDSTYTLRTKHGLLTHFDALGRQTATEDRNGNVTTYAYDPAGRLETITDPVDRETTFSYVGGLLDKITDPANRETSFDHDAGGNLTLVTFPDLTHREFDYDGRHLLTVATDERGFETVHDYDFAGRLERLERANTGERMTSNSQATGLVDPASGLGSQANPATLFRPGDAVSVVSDAQGRSTTFDTGRFGGSDAVIDAAGQTTLLERDGNGNTTREERPSGQTHTSSYDPLGNRQSQTDLILNGTTSFTYEPVFQLLDSITDARNKITTLTRNPSNGNLEGITSHLGRASSATYRADGQLETSTDVLNTVTTYGYDSNGDLTSIEVGTGLPNPRTSTISYTPEGYIDLLTDPVGRVTDFDYDPRGRLERQILPGSRIVDFGYDDAGNLNSITPPGRPAHLFEYGSTNQESLYDPPPVDAQDPATVFTYNLEDQLELIERPDGVLIDPNHDAAGRLSTITALLGVWSLGYDPNTGLLATFDEPGGVDLDYGYTGDRLSSITWSGDATGSVSWTRDPDGRLQTRQVNAGPAIVFGYDDDGLLTSAGALAIVRDPDSGLIDTTHLGDVDTSLTYNDFGELESDSAASVTAGALLSNIYVRDDAGRITTRSETIGGTTTVFEYRYDPVGRLDQVKHDSVVVATYGYDTNGNRLSRTTPSGTVIGVPDNQDRLVQYGNVEYDYNLNGDLESRTDTLTSETTTYDYDALGGLRSVSLPSGTTIAYEIDAQGRRVGRRVNGTLVKQWLYGDPLNPVAELDGAGSVVSRFVYGSRANVPEYMIKGGVTYRIISDHLGSVRLVVNTATGAVAQRMDYDEFGNVTQDTSAGFQPFGFAGGIYDPDTRLVRFGARDYDAEIGRWTAKDPILFVGGDTNLFSYSLNDPANLMDPFGLRWRYSQSSGQIAHVNDTTGETTVAGTGYSGSGAGRDNPAMQDVEDVGPIPEGEFTIGPQRDSRNTGPGVLDLVPKPGTNTFGRSGFQIHGDNTRRDKSASKGCIILGSDVRDTIAGSGDDQLQVVP